MVDLVVPPQWANLNLSEIRGTLMVIGASDTGKSTLARHLFQEACRRGRRAAFLDADVGQSTLGVPTTMTVALAASPGDDGFPPQGERATFFVGSTTPRGYMLPVVVGAHRLQEKAAAWGADPLIVDTTGFVQKSDGGKALKQWKIEMLRPSTVIGLERGAELEPILWPLRRDSRVRVVELPVSPRVVERSREVRVAHRREHLARYFVDAHRHVLSLRQLPVYDVEWLAPGAVFAFEDCAGLALALGAVEQADAQSGSAVVRTPLRDLADVHSLRFGAARWDITNGREL